LFGAANTPRIAKRKPERAGASLTPGAECWCPFMLLLLLFVSANHSLAIHSLLAGRVVASLRRSTVEDLQQVAASDWTAGQGQVKCWPVGVGERVSGRGRERVSFRGAGMGARASESQ